MTTTGKVHAMTSQPRMLVTNEIDNKLTKDPALKELKQLVEGDAGEDAGDWPRTLDTSNVKHAYYTVVNNPVLIDCRAIIPTAMRSQMLAALHRSHGGVEDMRARVRDAMFCLGMNNDIQ